MKDKSERYRNVYGNLYRKNGLSLELVSEDDIKKALKLRENTTNRKLSKEEIQRQRESLRIGKIENKAEIRKRYELTREEKQIIEKKAKAKVTKKNDIIRETKRNKNDKERTD